MNLKNIQSIKIKEKEHKITFDFKHFDLLQHQHKKKIDKTQNMCVRNLQKTIQRKKTN